MIDPTRQRQLEELDIVGLCTRILYQARNELYLNMRFLDVSLSSLGFEAVWNQGSISTDGHLIYYDPEALVMLYKSGRVMVNRAYLHMLFHCLFCHMYTRKDRDKALWDLSCDMAMEFLIDGLYQKCVHVPRSAVRREAYLRFQKAVGANRTMTAERIYQALTEMNLTPKRLGQLAAEFLVDTHERWEQEQPSMARQQQNQWNDNREKMQTAMETGSKDENESSDNDSLLEQVQVENRERYDYKQFLRKFSILKEEAEIDPDSFDYAFYSYGMALYGDMPLIEPLETREVFRIQDFVIVIDTSMSCSGELVLRFLEETYDVLSESESYSRKNRIHIIQCDDKVQSDVVVTSTDELKDYMEQFTIKGQGGTDFRPAFEHVNSLRASGEIGKLKGLLYFTDGQGIYPVQAPPYDTAFIFIENKFSDESVPPWAMKVVLEEEQLRELGHRKNDSSQEKDE